LNPLWTSFAIIACGGSLLVLGRLLPWSDRFSTFSLILHRVLGVGFFATLGSLVIAYVAHASFEVIASLALVSVAYVVGFVIPSTHLADVWSGFARGAQSPLGRVSIAGIMLVGITAASYTYLATLEECDPIVEFDDTASDYLAEAQNQNSGALDVAETPLYTDAGTPIAIKKLASDQPLTLAVVERQTEILRRFKLRDQLIQVPVGWQPCNCHGFTFTNGQFWISGDEVPTILIENGYKEIASPRQGDVAVYRNLNGDVVHTGVVFAANRDLILVESKWGKLGRFIHPHNRHCYAESACTFYRSARPGNIVHGAPHHEGTLFPDSNDRALFDHLQPAQVDPK